MGQDCYHCGEAIPGGFSAELTIADQKQHFCCYGCMAIAETIVSGGLENFYQHRTELSEKPLEFTPAQQNELALYDDPAMQADFVECSLGLSEAAFNISGITCAACIWLLEREINRIDGIESFVIHHTSHKARLQWRQDQSPLSLILLKIRSLGYQAHPYRNDEARKQAQTERRMTLFRIAVAGIASMQNMMFSLPIYLGIFNGIEAEFISLFRWVSMVMCTPVVFFAALPFLRAAIRDLKSRHLTMDIPVSLAILAAYFASSYITLVDTFSGVASIKSDVYFDSVSMFTFFLLLGRFLEMQARHKHLNSDSELGQLLPATAIVKTDQGEVSKPAHQLEIGDLLVVRQGQIAPADGIVIEGESSFDESALTGEFLPVAKIPGSHISGGTANIENTLIIRASAQPRHSRVAAIIKLLDQAQSEKPATVRLADQIASYFVAFVLFISTVTALYWWMNDPDQAFAIVLSVLVVTCPCALSLATPTALTAANTYLRSKGFLIAKGHVLEAMNSTTDIIFDKTGTLTEGNLRLEKTETFQNMNEQQALEIAAALEQHSSHPIAEVFKPFYKTAAQRVSTQLGKGLEGHYQGQNYRLGSLGFVAPDQQPPSEKAVTRPRLSIYLSDGNQLLACFSLSDTLRHASTDSVRLFQQHGIRVHILSGDQAASVQLTAQQLGIENFKSAQSPEQKLAYVQNLQQQGRQITMIGDGINDLPVLSGAKLSIAMGSASDIAKLNSDAVLLNDHLEVLNTAFQSAKTTRKIVKQNIIWAITYNTAMLPMAMLGWVPPYFAALGMSLSSLIVVFNSLRLKH